MDDTWEIFIQNTNDEELVTVPATYINGEIGRRMTLSYPNSTFIRGGILGKVLVRFNGKTVAVIDYFHDPASQLQAVAGQAFSFGYLNISSDMWVSGPAPKRVVKCSCGAAAVYGRDTTLHMDNISNTCELLLAERGLL
jgi:hypothetical protein